MHLKRFSCKLFWIQFMFLCISKTNMAVATKQNVTFHHINETLYSAKSPDKLSNYRSTAEGVIISEFSINININHKTFQWNKDIAPEQFQVTYCTTQLNKPQNIKRDMCPPIECFPCDNNKPLCQHYGTCCPDLHNLFPTNSSPPPTSADSSRTTSKQSDVTNNNDTIPIPGTLDEGLVQHVHCGISEGKRFRYIRSCRSNYPDSQVRSMCEVDIPLIEQEATTFLHVTDPGSGMTYFSKYCAICNDVTDFVHWTLEVSCTSDTNLYQAKTANEFFHMSQAYYSDCIIAQQAPVHVSLPGCNKDWIEGPVVDSCNVTGRWDIYDEDVETSCGEITGITNRVRIHHDSEKMYKNIFCALCNMNKHDAVTTPCISIPVQNDPGIKPAFKMLLNFRSETGRSDDQRHFNKYSPALSDPHNLDMSLKCGPGKILINGNCSTSVTQERGLVYKIQVMYLLKGPAQTLHITQMLDNKDQCLFAYNLLQKFQNTIETIISRNAQKLDMTSGLFSDRTCAFKKWTDELIPDFEASYCSMSICDHTYEVNRLTLSGFLLANSSLSGDELERFLIKELITKNIHFSIGRNRSLTLTPMLAPDRQNQHFSCPSARNEKLACDDYKLLGPNYENLDRYIQMDTENAILLEPQTMCPFVRFNTTQYLYDNNSFISPEKVSITLYIDDMSVIISEKDELNLLSIDQDWTLKVCRELLDIKINATSPNISENGRLTVMLQYVLTLVCLSVSILCLAVTLLTYSLFPVLRSVAGKNNMFLSGSLMLAQSSLLVASHIQQNGYLCTFFAISTHFLWLSKFCWCFTSCLHMFLTFTSKTRSIRATTSSEKKYIINRVVTCSVVPALIVIAVVVTNHFTSEGRLIGYGQTTCFLDSPTLVGITLVTPLGVVLISNICFFTITVVKINNIRKLQTGQFKKDDRNDMYIYVKLSSVTGMFWILAIISEATDNDPLRFIAIPLNGLQGVFIFLSYICNKRVSRLYLEVFGFGETGLAPASPRTTLT